MERLDHPCWLGGGPCAGKTTVSDAIARITGLDAYHVDQHRKEIHARADPARYPLMAQLVAEMSSEGAQAVLTRLFSVPPQDAFDQVRLWCKEETECAVEVLRESTSARRIIVDSTHALPEFIGEFASPDHVCFLVATEEVIRRNNAHRHAAGPSLGFTWPRELVEKQERSFIYRTGVIREDALRLGYAVVEVDARLGPEEVAERVMERLGL